MRRFKSVVVVATAAAVLGGLSAGAQPGVAEAVSPISVPAAAATLAEVVMTCGPGQVDVNAASVPAIREALGVDTPTATRVVALRPYLAPRDLLVVSGIGPDRLARILSVGNLCATPTSTPPPSSEHCSRAGLIDLQSISVEGLRAGLKLSANAAAAIVAARPFATMRHVTPERVPGVGKGTLDQVISRSCLTPMPVRTEQTSWRWAYPALTTTTSRDGYALQVAAGVVDDPSGAWTAITPMPTPSNRPGVAYPVADFHIHGAWAGPGQSVQVTVPPATFAARFPATDWQPYLIHWLDADGVVGVPVDGAALQVGADGSLTGSVTSLSVFEWAVRGLNWVLEPAAGVLFGNRYVAPACPINAWDQDAGGVGVYRNAGARAELSGALLDLPGNVPPPAGFLLKHCVEDGATAADDKGRVSVGVRLRNNSGTIMSLTPFSGGGTASIQAPTGVTADLVAYALTTVATDGVTFVAPGDTAKVSVPAASMGMVEMKPDRLRSLLRVGIDKTIGELIKKYGAGMFYDDPTLRQFVVGVIGCTYNTTKATVGSDWVAVSRKLPLALYGCLDYENTYFIIKDALDARLAAGTISTELYNSGLNGLLELRELVKWLLIGQIAVNVVDATVWGGLDTVPVTIEHYAARPSTDSQGHAVLDECVSARLYDWVIDYDCQNAAYAAVDNPPSGGGAVGTPEWYQPQTILRDPADGGSTIFHPLDKTVKFIDDGTTYICLAQRHAVDYAPNYRAYYSDATIVISPRATCDPDGPQRNLTPTSAALIGAAILREGTGRAWIVTAGTRTEIPSGAEFNCWVSGGNQRPKQLVWDWVTNDELGRFPTAASDTYPSCLSSP